MIMVYSYTRNKFVQSTKNGHYRLFTKRDLCKKMICSHNAVISYKNWPVCYLVQSLYLDHYGNIVAFLPSSYICYIVCVQMIKPVSKSIHGLHLSEVCDLTEYGAIPLHGRQCFPAPYWKLSWTARTWFSLGYTEHNFKNFFSWSRTTKL